MAGAEPGAEAARRERQRDPPERPCRPGTEVRDADTEVLVDGFEGGDRGANVERARDVRHREHDRNLRERNIHTQRVDRPAEEPEPSERSEQPDAGDREGGEPAEAPRGSRAALARGSRCGL